MDIIHKEVPFLTPTEYRACYLANYGREGYMRDSLVDCGHYEFGRVVMLWEGPADRVSSLIGWVLLTEVTTEGPLSTFVPIDNTSKYTAQFWVKKPYRKQGHGKTLMQEVKKLDPCPHVMPHDEASSELFSSFDVTVLELDSHWLRKKPKIA